MRASVLWRPARLRYVAWRTARRRPEADAIVVSATRDLGDLAASVVKEIATDPPGDGLDVQVQLSASGSKTGHVALPAASVLVTSDAVAVSVDLMIILGKGIVGGGGGVIGKLMLEK